MKSIYNNRMTLALALAATYFTLIGSGPSVFAESADLSTAVFYVQWYDVGKAALEGLAGVNQVENGFKNFKEINTVHYDPSLIKVKEMEQALKEAGTYLNTAN